MEEKVLNDAVLCFLVTDSEVCLALKKKKIGAGKLNGYGGGIEPGQTVIEAAADELYQETGGVTAEAKDLEKVAKMAFCNELSDGGFFVCTVHVFLVAKWQGIPGETEEMGKPEWFKKDCLPCDRMMPADRYWLPHVLAGTKLLGEARYSPKQEECYGCKMQFVNEALSLR